MNSHIATAMPEERATRERRNIGPLPVHALMAEDTPLDTVQFFQRLLAGKTGLVNPFIPEGKIPFMSAGWAPGDEPRIQMSGLKHFDTPEWTLSVIL